MTITIFHNTFFFGGGEKHTLGLASTLTNMGYVVTIVDCGASIYEIHKPSHLSVIIVTDPNIAYTRNLLVCYNRLAQYSADIALVITGGLKGFSLAAEAAIMLRYPRVVRIEHTITEPIQSYSRRLWFGFIPGLNSHANFGRLRRLVTSIMISRVITVSRLARLNLIKYCYMRPARVHVVHNGTNCSIVAQKPRKLIRDNLCVSNDCTLFICCGRLSYEKGIDIAIEAFAACRLSFSGESKLLIVGTGPLDSHLREMSVKLGVNNDVIFTGFQRDVASYMSASDCILFPSLTESFPLTLLEAMHFGCFPIASSVGGVPEMFIPGIPHQLIEPGNMQQLCDAMLSFLTLSYSQRNAAKYILANHVLDCFDDRVQYRELANVIAMNDHR